jgi:hypothetical protein
VGSLELDKLKKTHVNPHQAASIRAARVSLAATIVLPRRRSQGKPLVQGSMPTSSSGR